MDRNWFSKGETLYNKLGNKGSTKTPYSNSPFNLLLSEINDDSLKQLIRYYDTIGRGQVNDKQEKIKSLRDLANGIININDFIKSEEINTLQKLDQNIRFEEDDVDLEFFPIVPPIINRLVGEFDKKYLDFSIKQVNPEATNNIIEERNRELLQILQKSVEKQFEGGQVSAEEFKAQVEAKMSEYSLDYRTELEIWANHFKQICKEQFNLRNLERDIFKENLISEEPFVHINYQDNHFYPEIWNPEDVFYVKSKNAKDASDYSMIGRYSFIDFTGILQKYSLTEEQIQTLSKWTEYFTGATSFTLNGEYQFDGFGTNQKESAQNYFAARNLIQQGSSSSTAGSNREYVGQNRLVRETYMYFLVPEKVGILTAITNEGRYTIEVDDTFKPTIKPEYSHKDKKKENLIYGEHIEWTYINRLYTCIKLDMTFGAAYYESNKDFEPIYIKLGKHDIQFQHDSLRYGVKIPVHGGSTLGWSVTSKTAPWQKFYNYVWNRNKQLLSTEPGKFLLINQNILPQNSLDGSWQEDNLLKSFLVAREISLMPTDLSLTNTGQLQGGMTAGQVIDLDKTQEVLQKAQLAAIIKQECYDSLGLNPTFMAHTSPYQSAKSTSMSLDQTITQLQYLYSRHYDIMRKVWSTLIETGIYLTTKGELRNFSYTNSEGQRIIFNLNEPYPLLAKFNIYPTLDPNDIINMETTKQIILSNNTLGLDALGVNDIIFSKTPAEQRALLKEGIKDNDKRVEAQRKHEQEMQDKQIKAQQDAIAKQIENDNLQKQLDRDSKLEYARIDALKFSKDSVNEMSEEIKEMSKYNIEMAKLGVDTYKADLKNTIDNRKLDKAQEFADNKISLEERMKMKEIEIRDKELLETRRRNDIASKKNN
jgi:hypothetical protein